MAATYNVSALISMFLCVYVMQATEHDRINKVDVMWLQWCRRLGFTFAALSAGYSILAEWEKTLPVVLLMLAADMLLFVNAVALHRRGEAPPVQKSPVAVRKRAF